MKLKNIYSTFKRREPLKFTGKQQYQVNKKVFLELFGLAEGLRLLVPNRNAPDWRRLHKLFPNLSITTTDYQYWNESDRAQIRKILAEGK